MSKVEKALQKARAMEGMQPLSAALQTPQQKVIVNETQSVLGTQQLVPTSKELRPLVKKISNMEEPWRLSQADLAEAKIIFPEMQDNYAVDSFRKIRTKIVQESSEKNCVVLVTSTSENAGSSFVALNLASAFAFDESKTALLVDCNLRDPAYEYLVAEEIHYGLTDYLESDDIDIGKIIHHAGIQRLRVIPAGRKSEITTERLNSRKMKELLNTLKQRYSDRYTILDAASIESSDAKILSESCDFVLLVVPYGKTSESQIWNAAKDIDQKKFLGVVLNNQPRIPKISWN